MPEQPTLRLTYLITGLQYGGAEIGMVRLLSELSPEEYDITVVALADKPDEVGSALPDHIELKKLEMERMTDAVKINQLWPIINETDILVCSLFHATAVGVPLGMMCRVPKIFVWQHSTRYVGTFRSLYYRFAYRIADHVLADSEAVRSMLVEEMGVPGRKISVLPIAGIDPDVYSMDETSPERNCTFSVATVGRLTKVKGLDYVQRCANKLGPDVQFLVAGDGSMREDLERTVPNNVRLCGQIPNKNIPEFLGQADVYFQPSRDEGLCMTVIEAMACGLPIVASSVGGITESVVPGETGYLCEPGDIGCYVRSIEKLRSDADLRRNMGSAGRERVVNRYSRAELVERFREVVKIAGE